MISLRRSLTFIPLALLGLALAACDRAADTTQPLRSPDGASFGAGTGTTGNSAKGGHISARVLLNKAGVATFDISTGVINNADNSGSTDGWFDKIQYKVFDASGKQVLVQNVQPPGTNPSHYSEVIPVRWQTGYSVAVQANLSGVDGDRAKTDVVRDNAGIFNNPDIDLKANGMQIVLSNGSLVDPGQVSKGDNQLYQVAFSNLPHDLATVGVVATCEVHIFNSAGQDITSTVGLKYFWKPNGSPVTSADNGATSTPLVIPATQTSTCQFSANLSSVGTYKFRVTGNSVSPLDYDVSNNTVEAFIQAIDGTPIHPRPGGFGRNGTASDYQFYSSGLAYLGDSAQTAAIDSLSGTVLTASGLTGTFALKLHFYTVDSVWVKNPGGDSTLRPVATRDLAQATWTGSLPDVVVAAQANPFDPVIGGNCVFSDNDGITFGTMSVDYAKNKNKLAIGLCVVPQAGDKLSIAISIRWSPPRDTPSSPAQLIATADGSAPFGDYLFYDTELSFSAEVLGAPVVSHAPVRLTDNLTGPSTGFAFNAAYLRKRAR